MYKDRDNSAPTDDELIYLGFEQWQIRLMREFSPDLQWVVHDEFIRRLMAGDDVDNFNF